MPRAQIVIYNKSKNKRLWVLEDGRYSLDGAVLALLLQEKHLTTYEIKKKLQEIGNVKIPYSTLHGIIKGLAKAKYLIIDEKEPFRRTKLEKKFYKIAPIGVGSLFQCENLSHKKILVPDQFIKYIGKKGYLHPFLSKIKEWRLNETPVLAMELFKSPAIFPWPHFDVTSSVEKITQNFVRELIGRVFWDYFNKINEQTKYGFPYPHAYAENALGKEAEVALFIKNNPWIKAKVKEHLEEDIENIKAELDIMKKVFELPAWKALMVKNESIR